MQAFFHFLATNPYILLFVTVGLAVWLGRQTVAGYGLGMVAAAIVVGCALSVWGFMYGVGLRVGPSFFNSFGGDGIKFTFLAVVSCVVGLALVVAGAKVVDLPL